MRKILVFMLVICANALFAQVVTIEQKEKELAKAQLQADSINAAIKAIKAEITALKPPVYWKKGGFTAVNFNNVSLNNWAAGGVQSSSVSLQGNAFADYKKNNVSWVNNLDLAYGLIKNAEEDIRKNEDKIDFLSKYGYKATEKINYAALANLKTQFAPGYDFSDLDPNRPIISQFFAPAYINVSLGMDFKPKEWISIYVSPAAGKFTIVADDTIAAQHTYIPDATDAEGKQFYNDNYRAEFGASVNILFNKEMKNISVKSRLDLFNNYTDKNTANRENIDVNWENTVNLKITKFIGASLFTHLIYDDDVDVPTVFNEEGVPLAFGPRTQFKTVFGLGFSYKF